MKKSRLVGIFLGVITLLEATSGEVTLQNQQNKSFSFKKNWWYYLLSADNAIAAHAAMQ